MAVVQMAHIHPKLQELCQTRIIGQWLIIRSMNFDLEVNGIPHQSITVLYNLQTKQYVCQNLGRQCGQGSFPSQDLLVEFCLLMFNKTACLGFRDTDESFPLSCLFAKNCTEYANQPDHRCPACHAQWTSLRTSYYEPGMDPNYGPSVTPETRSRMLVKEEYMTSELSGMEMDPNDMGDYLEPEVQLDAHSSSHVNSIMVDMLGESPGASPVFRSKLPRAGRRGRKKGAPKHPVGEKSEGKKTTWPCELCAMVSNSRTCYYNHKRKEHFFGKFLCHICDERHLYAQDYARHVMAQHNESAVLRCPVCTNLISFENDPELFGGHYTSCVVSTALERGKRSQKGYKPTPTTCDECGKTYNTLGNLKKHKKIHRGEALQCPECEYVAVGSTRLAQHMEVHQRGRGTCKVTLCQFCGVPCEGYQQHYSHLRLHHRTFPCPDCGEMFKRQSWLLRHRVEVHKFDRYKCPVCYNIFPTNHSLRRHELIHQEPTIKCRFCDSMFRTGAGVKNHERTHTGETPFNCNICDYSCKSSATLSLHRKFKHNGGQSLRKNPLPLV